MTLTTGIRAEEASTLVVADLRQTFGGELSLHIRHGKGYKKIRPSALSTRSIQDIVSSYIISIGGALTTLTPHSLRRSYARILFLAGMDPGKIQQNMGHENIQTTFDYIGVLDAADRRPPNALFFDVASYLREVLPRLLFSET